MSLGYFRAGRIREWTAVTVGAIRGATGMLLSRFISCDSSRRGISFQDRREIPLEISSRLVSFVNVDPSFNGNARGGRMRVPV